MILKKIIKLRYGFYGRILNKHRQLIYQLERNIIKKICKILLNDGLIDESDIEIEKEYTRIFFHNLLKLSYFIVLFCDFY